MTGKYLFVGLVLVAVVGAIAVGGMLMWTPAMAQEGDNAETPAAASDSEPVPVVAAMPYESTTQYQMDPFEPSKVRSTETKTDTLILVRADGSTEIVSAR